MNYPKRCPFFSHKFVRLLMKSCATMDIGHHACLLLCYIVHTEDAAKYSGPVRFWNDHLMNVMGFRSPKQLNDCRQKAIDFGWLIYERSGTRQVGRYMVTIPANFEGLSDDPIEESLPLIRSEIGTNSGTNSDDSFRIRNESRNELRNEKVTNPGMNCGKPSIPIPVPKTIQVASPEIVIPEKLNTTPVCTAVQQWFAYLLRKGKDEKVPQNDDPAMQTWWNVAYREHRTAEGLIQAIEKAMAEGWVNLRKPIAEKTNGVHQESAERFHLSEDWATVRRICCKIGMPQERRNAEIGEENLAAIKTLSNFFGRMKEAQNDFDFKSLAVEFFHARNAIRAKANGTATAH